MIGQAISNYKILEKSDYAPENGASSDGATTLQKAELRRPDSVRRSPSQNPLRRI